MKCAVEDALIFLSESAFRWILQTGETNKWGPQHNRQADIIQTQEEEAECERTCSFSGKYMAAEGKRKAFCQIVFLCVCLQGCTQRPVLV